MAPAIVAALFLLSVCDLFAQREYNIWYFPLMAGLDFNGGAPVPLTDNAMFDFGDEASAVFSDPATGKLLFYVSGEDVWNANHQFMANGRRLAGHISSTQGALIVPLPGSSTLYYVFTTDAGDYYEPPNVGLHYSIVDMTQENGLGAVTQKNVELLNVATEKLTAVRHCNGRDFWILAHGWGDNSFYAYRLTPAGLKPPVVTSIGSVHGGDPQNSIGWLRASPDGRRLVSVVTGTGSVELFNFDNRTGTVFNRIDLPGGNQEYGASFSPDNTKLYITRTTQTPDAIYQYDVSSSDPSTIIASRTNVAVTVGAGALALGPDGKLYLVRKGEIGNRYRFLSVFDNPNLAGAASGFRLDAIDLAGRETRRGLPNNIDAYRPTPNDDCLPPRALFAPSRLEICVGECIDYTDRSERGATKWEWRFDGASIASSSDRNPANVCYAAPGSYTVRLIASKMLAQDDELADTVVQTIVVHPSPTVDAGPDRNICERESVTLTASQGDTYEWTPSPGLSCTDCRSPVATPSVTTTYTVTVTNEFGCKARDSVTVFIKPAPIISVLPSATTICSGESVQLRASGGTTYSWTPTDRLSCTDCPEPIANPSKSTMYIVSSSTPGTCEARDTVIVTVVEAMEVEAGNDPTICLGDSVTIGATATPGAYSWTPTTGLSCADCLTPRAAPTTTTTYTLTASSAGECVAVDRVTVTVLPPPQADAGGDELICLGDTARLHAIGGVSYRWEPATGLSCTDCQTPLAFPDVTTAYFVTVTGAEGCVARDVVTVRVDRSPRTVRTHIENAQGPTGATVRVPLLLDDRLDSAAVDSLMIDLTYDDGMMVLRSQDLKGGILEGWDLKIIEAFPGRFSAMLVAPPFTTLKGTGKMLDLAFLLYLRTATESCIEYTISLPGNNCTRIVPDPGCIELDPFCGATIRFVVGTNEGYALEENRPNPFNPETEIPFSLGLDGHTVLTVVNASGEEVARLVNERMEPGRYIVSWNGAEQPSGVYYVRLTSGDWSASRRILLVK